MTKTEMSCQHKVLCEQIHRKNTRSGDGFYLECEKNLMIIKKTRMHLKIFYSKSVWPSTQISRNVAALAFLQQLRPLLLLLPCSKRSICTGTGNWTQTDLTNFFLSFSAGSVKKKSVVVQMVMTAHTEMLLDF